MSMKYCGNCEYLDPKESEQDTKESHRCILYNRRVFHAGHHPNIIRPIDCQAMILIFDEVDKQDVNQNVS